MDTILLNSRDNAASGNLPKDEAPRTQTFRVADTHCHVIFGVDDGSDSIDMSLAMLRSMEQQGVSHVFCTSHSFADTQKYNQNFDLLKEAAAAAGIEVTLHTGCEIFCSEYELEDIICGIHNGKYPTLAGTEYVLVEFDKYAPADEILFCVQELASAKLLHSGDRAIIPVIAHAEQYRNLLADVHAYETLKQAHFHIQINAYSLEGERKEKVRTLARKLLDDRLVTFIGSDCHKTTHRPPLLQAGIDYIYSHCDTEYARDICYRNAERLLLGMA